MNIGAVSYHEYLDLFIVSLLDSFPSSDMQKSQMVTRLVHFPTHPQQSPYPRSSASYHPKLELWRTD